MDEQQEQTMHEQEQRRERAAHIVALLRQAQSLVPLPHRVPLPGERPPRIPYSESRGTLEEFEENLYHGEYELAWGALAAVAQRTNAGRRCAEILAEAAMGIQVYERYDTYFMEYVVRPRTDQSAELDAAIAALPRRFSSMQEREDAQQLVTRLAMMREQGAR